MPLLALFIVVAAAVTVVALTAHPSKGAAFGEEPSAPIRKVVDDLLAYLKRNGLEPSNVWREGTKWEAPVIFEFYTEFSAHQAREFLPWSLNIAAEMVPIQVRVKE